MYNNDDNNTSTSSALERFKERLRQIKLSRIKKKQQDKEETEKFTKERLKEISEEGIIRKEKEEKTEVFENVQYLIEQLKQKRNKTMLHLYKNVYRLKKAFPTINTKEITEILSKKVELKEIKEKLKTKKLK